MSQSDAANHAAHDKHGNSIAAWTGVTVIMIASLVMAIGVAMPSQLVFWGGVVLAGLGVVVGKVLAAMGFGISGKPGA